MMYTISVEIGGSFAAARRRSRASRKPVLYDTMVHLHARACQVVFEIGALIVVR